MSYNKRLLKTAIAISFIGVAWLIGIFVATSYSDYVVQPWRTILFILYGIGYFISVVLTSIGILGTVMMLSKINFYGEEPLDKAEVARGLVGYKRVGLHTYEGVLYSYFSRELFPERFLKEAKCIYRRNHTAPSWYCDCGYYASFNKLRISPGEALLLVSAIGPYVQHVKGFRSQRMRVDLIKIHDKDYYRHRHSLLQKLRERYGVPVEVA